MELNTQNMQKTKKSKLRRVLFILCILACVFVLSFLVWKKINNKTVVLSNRYDYVPQYQGKGILTFYELVPDFKLDDSKNREDYNNKRYRVDDAIFTLSDKECLSVKSALEKYTNLSSTYDKTGMDFKLVNQKISYLQKIVDSKQLIMPFSGRVQLSVDGYEEIFTPESLSNMSPDDFSFNSDSEKLFGIKFVENKIFYLTVQLPQSFYNRDFSVDSYYSLKINENIDTNGKLVQIKNNDKNETLLTFEMRVDYDKLHEFRFVDVQVLLDMEQVFFIPLDAIFEEADEFYVYVVNSDNIIQKVKIQFIGYMFDRHEAVVIDTSKYPEENGSTRYLKKFDNIIINAEEFKEGDKYQ